MSDIGLSPVRSMNTVAGYAEAFRAAHGGEYPSFPAFIIGLREERKVPFKDIAEAVNPQRPPRELTIQHWSEGGAVGTQLQSAIEHNLDYRFAERGFWEATTEMGFPPSNAHDVIRTIRSHAEFARYLAGVVFRNMTQKKFSEFMGIDVRRVSAIVENASAMDRAEMVIILTRITELREHLRGACLSRFTPRRVMGYLLNQYRLKRGMSRPKYVEQIGTINRKHYGLLEQEGTTSWDDERARSYFKDDEHPAVLAEFIAKEREELGGVDLLPIPGEEAFVASVAAPAVADAIRPRILALIERHGIVAAAAKLETTDRTLRRFREGECGPEATEHLRDALEAFERIATGGAVGADEPPREAETVALPANGSARTAVLAVSTADPAAIPVPSSHAAVDLRPFIELQARVRAAALQFRLGGRWESPFSHVGLAARARTEPFTKDEIAYITVLGRMYIEALADVAAHANPEERRRVFATLDDEMTETYIAFDTIAARENATNVHVESAERARKFFKKLDADRSVSTKPPQEEQP